METVLCLTKYRKKLRTEFLTKYSDHLDQFLQSYIHHHFNMDFNALSGAYLQSLSGSEQSSWNYLDLREALNNALLDNCGADIFEQLRKTYWFDEKLMSIEQVIDRCLSLFVLNDCAKIS